MCLCPDEVFRGQEQSSGAGRSVSAADVVLFGVNIVLPLMSQDLLKVRTPAFGVCCVFVGRSAQWKTFVCTSVWKKVVLFLSLVYVITC